MRDPEIFLVATEDKDTPCLEPLASALSEQGQTAHLLNFFLDLTENGGSGLKAFVEAPFPVAVISSVFGIELLTRLRPLGSFLCVCVEHGVAPFKSYTYGKGLLSAHYYLAPTIGWASRLVSMYPEQRSKVRLGGYPKIDAIGEAISVAPQRLSEKKRILVILSWGVREDSLGSLPDFPFIDYLLHPADRRLVSATCMQHARVIVSSPDVSFDLIGQASLIVGDFSSLTLECLYLGRDVVFMIDPTLYKGGCDLDDHFFDRNKASFGVVPATTLRVKPEDTITADSFRALIAEHGDDVVRLKAATPRASFPAEFLPPLGSNRARCAAELISIIRQESQIPATLTMSARMGTSAVHNMRLLVRTYEAVLGRAPDPIGLKHYLDVLSKPEAGTSEAIAIVGHLNASPEAARKTEAAASRRSIDELTAVLAREARVGDNKAAMLLDALCERILPDVHRRQRDESDSNPVKIQWGMKIVCSADAMADDFTLLAHALAGENRLDDALHWLTKALEKDPDAGELQRFRASLLERMCRHEEALQAAILARELDADVAAISCDIARLKAIVFSRSAPKVEINAEDNPGQDLLMEGRSTEIVNLDRKHPLIGRFLTLPRLLRA